uniref:Protein artemis n=1 Tax=Steinernema glaseri TaxID=37863 RepID=A0A1I8AHZ1_9BILA
METVPRLFIESVCLRLLDRESLAKSTKIPSAWGEICTAISKKIHTLRVYLDGTAERIYAAAQPVQACNTNYNLLILDISQAVPLDSIDLKFVTNFRIETHTPFMIPLSSSYKEITLDELQRLVHFIRPFFETTGPLYCVSYLGPALKQRTLDALIDKFVPIDGGCFHVHQKFSEEQMKKLFEKCVMSDQILTVTFVPEDIRKIFDSTGPIDYDKFFTVSHFPCDKRYVLEMKKRKNARTPRTASSRTRKSAFIQRSLRAESDTRTIFAAPTMNTVPRLFIESVLDRESLSESRSIKSTNAGRRRTPRKVIMRITRKVTERVEWVEKEG